MEICGKKSWSSLIMKIKKKKRINKENYVRCNMTRTIQRLILLCYILVEKALVNSERIDLFCCRVTSSYLGTECANGLLLMQFFLLLKTVRILWSEFLTHYRGSPLPGLGFFGIMSGKQPGTGIQRKDTNMYIHSYLRYAQNWRWKIFGRPWRLIRRRIKWK